MNRLLSIEPQQKGILLSKSELAVVKGGACDFYTIQLAERVETPVVISIRATHGEVQVTPDTLQIKPEDYNEKRRIVVVGRRERGVPESTEDSGGHTELLHFVSSKTPEYDGFAFRLPVSLISARGTVLLSFGSNLHFQLAQDCSKSDKTFVTQPKSLLGLPAKTVAPHLSTGGKHTCAVLQDGTLYGWGDGSEGQLAVPPPESRGRHGASLKRTNSFFPRHGSEPNKKLPAAQAAADAGPGGGVTDVARKRTAEVKARRKLKGAKVGGGREDVAATERQLASRAASARRSGPVESAHGMRRIVGGGRTTSSSDSDGDNVTSADRSTGAPREKVLVPRPRIISALEKVFVVQVACGDAHTLILTLQGMMYSFGSARNGRLGVLLSGGATTKGDYSKGVMHNSRRRQHQPNSSAWKPQLIEVPAKVREIGAGGAFSACIDDGDALYTWGSNATGQLGLGHADDVWQPQKVEVIKTPVLQLSCGKNHTAVLTYEGQVFTTGQGDDGRLGHGDTHSRYIFERIKALPCIRFVCAGGTHTGALDSSFQLWMWGNNCCGQLGLSHWHPFLVAPPVAQPSQHQDPAAESAASGAGDVATSKAHDAHLLLRADEERGTTAGRKTTAPATDVRAVDSAPRNANGMKRAELPRKGGEAAENTLTVNGRNETSTKNASTVHLGAEGYETICAKPQVVEFLRGKQVVRVALGELYSLAITARGMLYAWGSHDLGQLGITDRLDNQPLPVMVPAFLSSPAVQVFAGPCSSCTFVTCVGDVFDPSLPTPSHIPAELYLAFSRSAFGSSGVGIPYETDSSGGASAKEPFETGGKPPTSPPSWDKGSLPRRRAATPGEPRTNTTPRALQAALADGLSGSPHRARSMTPRLVTRSDIQKELKKHQEKERRRVVHLATMQQKDRHQQQPQTSASTALVKSRKSTTSGHEWETALAERGGSNMLLRRASRAGLGSQEDENAETDKRSDSVDRAENQHRRGAINGPEHPAGGRGRKAATRGFHHPRDRGFGGIEETSCAARRPNLTVPRTGGAEEAHTATTRSEAPFSSQIVRSPYAGNGEAGTSTEPLGGGAGGGSSGPSAPNLPKVWVEMYQRWYTKLQNREEEERRAADARYRLRRGQERMEILKKPAFCQRAAPDRHARGWTEGAAGGGDTTRASKLLHPLGDKDETTDEGPVAASPTEKERSAGPAHKPRTGQSQVRAALNSSPEAGHPLHSRKIRLAATLFSAGARRRPADFLYSGSSDHAETAELQLELSPQLVSRGTTSKEKTGAMVEALKCMPLMLQVPSCWPEAPEATAAASCSVDRASTTEAAHGAWTPLAPHRVTETHRRFFIPWKYCDLTRQQAIPLYTNASVLRCTFVPTETSARLFSAR